MIYFRSAFVFSVFLFVLLSGTLARAGEKPAKLVFSQVLGSQSQQVGADILKKVYASLGIQVGFQILPARRSLQVSGNGETDGEVFRIREVGLEYPNLIRIPTQLMTFKGYAYTVNGIEIDQMDNLDKYRVGIIRGYIWAERGVKSTNIVRVEDNAQLLIKLIRGGIDVAVSTEYTFEREIRKNGTVRNIITRGKPLISFDVFHYLNRKYQDLVPDIDEEIKKLHDSGEITKLTTSY